MANRINYLIAAAVSILIFCGGGLEAQILLPGNDTPNLMPYVGLESGLIESTSFDQAIEALGYTPLSHIIHPLDGIMFGVTFRPFERSLSVSMEYSTFQTRHIGERYETDLSAHGIGLLFGYPLRLWSQWRALLSAGFTVGLSSIQISDLQDFDMHNFSHRLANPGTTSRQLLAQDLRGTLSAMAGYGIVCASDTIKTRYLALNMRIGTDIPITTLGWEVNGIGDMTGPSMPRRAIFVDFTISTYQMESESH